MDRRDWSGVSCPGVAGTAERLCSGHGLQVTWLSVGGEVITLSSSLPAGGPLLLHERPRHLRVYVDKEDQEH